MISLVSLLLLACVCAQHFEPRRIEASGRDPVLVTTCDLSGDGVVDSAVADFLVRARGVRPFCFCFLFHVPSLVLRATPLPCWSILEGTRHCFAPRR